jgi:hypothetical protein
MAGFSLGYGLAPSQAAPPSDQLDLAATPGGEMQIQNSQGTLTITVSTPAAYAGTYIVDVADLALGPVNLAPAAIVEGPSVEVADTLTLTPGLWIYDADVGGIQAPTYQWQADTGGDASYADLSGATATSYTLAIDEQGDGVRVVETLTDLGGSRSAASAPVSVAMLFIDAFDTYSDGDELLDTAAYAERYASGGWLNMEYDLATDTVQFRNQWAGQVTEWEYTTDLANDQFIEATVQSVDTTSGNRRFSLCLRMQPGARTFYQARYSPNPLWHIYKVVDGVATELAVYTPSAFAPGDKWRFGVRGDDLILLTDTGSGFVERMNVSDPGGLSGGRAGGQIALSDTGDYKLSELRLGEL